MDFDTLITHYFGSTDLDALSSQQLGRGLEALSIDFGVTREPGRKFALWTLMHMLGAAPDIETAFENEEERDAARQFAEFIESDEGYESDG